jgi:hypothetical protein
MSVSLLKNVAKVFLLGMCTIAFAEENQISMNQEEWHGKGLSTIEDGGQKHLQVKGPGLLFYKKEFKVDPTQSYTLKAEFKSGNTKTPNLFFGLICLDENKKHIATQYVNVLRGSETELTQACSAEDKVVKVKNAAAWKTDKYSYIAFDIDNSGKFKDLPNNKLSSMGLLKIKEKDGIWNVTLKSSCGQTFPAGTKVRLHRSGGTYLYSIAINEPVLTEWTELEDDINGQTLAGFDSNKFKVGTKYVRIIGLINFQGDNDTITLIKNVGFNQN